MQLVNGFGISHTLLALATPALNGVNFSSPALKRPALKGQKFTTFFQAAALFFSSYLSDRSLITSSEKGVWGRGGDADICKCTQIRNTLFVIV